MLLLVPSTLAELNTWVNAVNLSESAATNPVYVGVTDDDILPSYVLLSVTAAIVNVALLRVAVFWVLPDVAL